MTSVSTPLLNVISSLAAALFGASGAGAGTPPAQGGHTYTGSVAEATAALHLMGAQPSDIDVVGRSVSRTAKAITVKERVRHLDPRAESRGWERQQILFLAFAPSTSTKAKLVAQVAPGGGTTFPSGVWCMGRTGRSLGHVGYVPSTNVLTVTFAPSVLRKCGIPVGAAVNMVDASELFVSNNPAEAAAATLGTVALPSQNGQWAASGAPYSFRA